MSQSNKCRVYVGNISWKVKWQDLKDHMKQVGEVVRADIIEDYDGKSKGCGVVEYVDEETAQKAMKELNDTMLFDRPIFVREDREQAHNFRSSKKGNAGKDWQQTRGGRSPSGDATGVCVIVTNLQWKTSWQDLKDLFKSCASVNSCMYEIVFFIEHHLRLSMSEDGHVMSRVDVLTRDNGKSKGVAKVYVPTEEDANALINKFNDYLLDGRNIGVKLDQKEHSSSA
ncbi:putative RNA-binding protein [Babesia sp. Xinjiang]|uniref:putative RNA-binding protein n=1 Tax=Babesia sp. Xinjiang TaxID=462227 RepID=UPI000A251D59|nr:putative RNA-binding protein [Babesia sp. Xinjiang]ORM40360.1 putative RNA-binding protein [Babesia sp. Xinjiang]